MKLTENEILTLMRLVGSEQHFNEKYMEDVAKKNKFLKNLNEKLANALTEINKQEEGGETMTLEEAEEDFYKTQELWMIESEDENGEEESRTEK